ncbi:putative decarboxylase domain protein [Mycobacterium kansasii]|uniref:Putative decarboxylase domain protein n=1 Tax=Mycobacterium kansasii TaxID=1768 RepID=A0A1V3XGL7_MYCKA|nr:putative decarboxylase domain protein [Mycobacterium kansasii]
MTDAVLGNTYDLPASDFAAMRRSTTDRALAAAPGHPMFLTRRTSMTHTSFLSMR